MFILLIEVLYSHKDTTSVLDALKLQLMHYGKELEALSRQRCRLYEEKIQLQIDEDAIPSETSSVSSARALMSSDAESSMTTQNTLKGFRRWLEKALHMSPREDLPRNSPEKNHTTGVQEPMGYIKVQDELFMVPVDSENFRGATERVTQAHLFDAGADHNIAIAQACKATAAPKPEIHDKDVNLPTTLPAADQTESLFDYAEESDDEDINLSTTPSVADQTDSLFDYAEESDGEPLGSLSFQHQTVLLIAETVRLRQCKKKGSTKLKFCIERISISEDCQVMCAAAPCTLESDSNCQHSTVEIDDHLAVQESLPRRIELKEIGHLELTRDHLRNRASQEDASIPLFLRCAICHHTKVDNVVNQSISAPAAIDSGD